LWQGERVVVGTPAALRWVPLLAEQAVLQRTALAIAARLDHPNVARILEVVELPGGLLVATELLHGQDLEALLADRPAGLSVEEVADLLLGVCGGLHAAHELGLVHGSLQAGSVLLAELPFGERVPKVLGVGCSGGPLVEGSGRAEPRDDQLAVGRILRRMLAREGNEGVAPLPAPLIALVARATQPRPADRFASLHALGRALLPFASPRQQVAWMDHYVSARPPVTPGPS
jgi:serine/threonine protein kinase